MDTASAWSEPATAAMATAWVSLASGESHARLRHYTTTSAPPDKAHAAAVEGRPHLLVGLTAEQVEPWQRFPYLLTGYRRGGTHMQCIYSMFGDMHNETVNAWSMVVSTLAGVMVLWHALEFAKWPAGWDASPFWVHFVAQFVHFPASLGYHTFMPISAATAHRWRRADLCLVIALNIACNYSMTYFTIGHWAALGLTAFACIPGGMAIYSILSVRKGKPLNRTRMVFKVAGTAAGYYCVMFYRAIITAAAAMQQHPTGSMPEVLLAYVLPRWVLSPEVATAALMLLLHTLGATVYATHWPQRHFPRVFDLCGFSHNLMHVFCFVVYVWGYWYMALLHAKQNQWFGLP